VRHRETLSTHGRAAGLVGSGGAVGATARYAVELGVPSTLGATFAANVAGCFLLGVLVAADRPHGALTERARLLVGTGFCSSFTTYSTFVLDLVRAAPTVALGYLLASYGAGFLAVVLASYGVERAGATRGGS
jgi:Integral membrane protein possibly involved in chromosome condensation